MSDKEELIWVSKEIAERWKEISTKQNAREMQEKVFNEYIEKVSNTVKADFKANLESLEEDAAMFTGLMIKVKQAFEKAKNEQLLASETLWEKFEKDIPNTTKKIESLITVLKPLKTELQEINELCGKIDTWQINRLHDAVNNFASLWGNSTSRAMFQFLVNNFKIENKQE
jgi:hypothetical protein